MRKQLTPDAQTWKNMQDSLRTLKSRCASQERQIKRLLAADYHLVWEDEIAMLEERITDLLRCNELAELEVLQLKRQLQIGNVA